MNIVGMVSSYREGSLLRAALDSLQTVDCDRIYVYEGPAGDPLDAVVPASELPHWFDKSDPRCVFHAGRWRTDARKRNEMLQHAKRDYPGLTWAVIVDGDEVLVNGTYLRDRLQSLVWDDEAKGARAGDVDNPPWARWPLHLVENDGSISIITARVVRIDLLRSIDVSSSVVTNAHGVREGWGNYAARSAVWIEGWLNAIDKGQMIAWPPLPCEPHIVHRSNLRHPLRRKLRMSEQEAEEFARVQAEEAALKKMSNGDSGVPA